MNKPYNIPKNFISYMAAMFCQDLAYIVSRAPYRDCALLLHPVVSKLDSALIDLADGERPYDPIIWTQLGVDPKTLRTTGPQIGETISAESEEGNEGQSP